MDGICLEICPKEVMNVVSDVFIVLYYGSDELKFSTLVDKDGGRSLIHEKVDEQLDCYNPPLAAGRKMLSLFSGLLSPASLENGEFQSTREVLNKNPDWHSLWTHVQYYPWIKKFAFIDVIYDEIDHIYVYFFKLNIEDDLALNSFMKENDLDVSFEFSTQKEIKVGNTLQRKIIEFFDFELHIKNTIEFIQEPYDGKPVYLCFDHRPHQIDNSKPYIPSDCLYPGIYRRNFEIWKEFSVGQMQFPGPEILKNTKAIFFPGSSSSIYDKKDWIIKLIAFIQDIYQNTQIKLFGACFGAQALAKSLGGDVGPMEGRKSDPNYYYHDVEEMKLTDEYLNHPFFKSLNRNNYTSLNIFEAHGDNINIVPKNTTLLAKSQTCPVEFFVENNNRFIGFQGHPEYEPKYCTYKGAMYMNVGLKGKLTLEECIEKVRLRIHTEDSDSTEIKKIAYAFIKTAPVK